MELQKLFLNMEMRNRLGILEEKEVIFLKSFSFIQKWQQCTNRRLINIDIHIKKVNSLECMGTE